MTILENMPREDINLASVLNNLAMLSRVKMNYVEAETLYKRAITIAERTTEAQQLAVSLTGLGGVYEDQGDLKRAGLSYERSVEVAERTLGRDHPDTAGMLNNLGLLYMKQGNNQRARPLLERALAINEKRFGSETLHSVSPLLNLAKLSFDAGEVSKATNYLNRSCNIQERTLDLVLKAGSEKQKRLYLATLTNETDGIVSMTVDSGSDNPRLAELSMTTVLRRKGRALDAMSKQVETLRARMDPKYATLFDELADVRGRLATLMLHSATETDEARQTYASALETQMEQLEQRVAESGADFRQDLQAINVDRVQSRIPPEAALVDIVSYRRFNAKAFTVSERFGDSRYVAFVLHRVGQPVWVELGDASVIDASVSQLRSAFQNRKSINAKTVARALDEQVMQPIRKLLGDSRQILLSPDGGLNLLPFGALVDEQDRYLIENYSITYLTSGRDLLRTPASDNQKPNRPLVMANPLFDRTSSPDDGGFSAPSRSTDFTQFKYSPLPATAIEAREIAKVLSGAEVLTEANATESALKKFTRPRVLHLATHGFFLSDQKGTGKEGRSLVRERVDTSVGLLENPLLRSGLILAGVSQRNSGPGEDGVLSALEATGLDLRGTELVVLSACETGIGEIKVGDGVFGLRRALVLAGAESQVTSLWQVDDKATRDLMVDFYTRLKNGEGKGEALRNAQLTMMRSAERAHPYFWASFIEIGDWKPLRSLYN